MITGEESPSRLSFVGCVGVGFDDSGSLTGRMLLYGELLPSCSLGA